MVEEVTPDVVINCIGAVKQVPAAQDPIHAIRINSLFPHEVASTCAASGARFIHVSTDCVFSGATGMYSEADRPDAEDLYGRAKLLGEVTEPHLTLRTSIIGRELMGQHGLLEWFLSQEEAVRGYRLAFFSGLTTLALARVLDSVINDHPRLAGLFHVAAARIDKFSLLEMLNGAFMKGLAIIPDDEVAIDRSLDGGRFERLTGIAVPSWEQMITEMADDSTELGYEKIRQLTDREAEASS